MAAKKKTKQTSAAFTGATKKSIRKREKVLGQKPQSASKIKARANGERAAKNRVAKIQGRQAKSDASMARRVAKAQKTGNSKGLAKAQLRASKNKDIRTRKTARAATLSASASSGAGGRE